MKRSLLPLQVPASRWWRGAGYLAFSLFFLLLLSPLVGAKVPQAPQSNALLAEATWELTAPIGWSTKPVVICVTVTDSDGLQEATSQYRYSTDGGANWSTWASDAALEHSSPVSSTVYLTLTLSSLIDSGLSNKVQFRITDLTSAIENSPTYTIKVDSTSPGAPIGLAADPSDWTNQDNFTLSWTNPSDLSGVVKAYYKIGSTPPLGPTDVTGSQEGEDIRTLTNISLGSHGPKKVYVWLEDRAGNSDYTHYSEVTLWLDQQAPSGPQSLAADPSGWTDENSFDLSWTNPPQSDSPIYRAYYKFFNAPTSNSDYSGSRSGMNIWQITDLSVPSSGEVPCYVWLEDKAGNADHTTAVSVTLYYSGGSAPPPPFALQIEPSSWTATGVFTATWTNPPAPAGIQAAWYKWGDPPTSPSDGTRVPGAGIHRLEGLTPPSEGAWDLHVWLEDGAGSKDQNNRRTVVAHYDATPPVTTPEYSPPLPSKGWFSSTVTVTLTVSDVASGPGATYWRRVAGLWNEGNSFQATAEHPGYEFYSVDNAGNIEETQRITVPIDIVPPTSQIEVTPTVPASGWYTATVSVVISATDDLSGVDQTWYRLDGGSWQEGDQFVVASEGESTPWPITLWIRRATLRVLIL
ncbi:MAG: hypothetical protein J7M05_11435 [Anaerolineae bacterium]|nr:hypothetical protein [Anaerolineae bacterium]